MLCPEKIERRHQDKYRRRLRKEGELKNDAPGCSPSSCVPLCGRRNEKVPRRERRPFVRRRKGRLESHSARFPLLAELGGRARNSRSRQVGIWRKYPLTATTEENGPSVVLLGASAAPLRPLLHDAMRHEQDGLDLVRGGCELGRISGIITGQSGLCAW